MSLIFRKLIPTQLPIIASLLSLLLTVPIITILASVLTGSYEIWGHLWETVMVDYLINSLLLVIGVGIGVLILGLPAAWLTSVCDFPMRKIFVWALLLPMAMPAYIIAYTYTGLLDFAGPVQKLIRELTGWHYGEYWFFEIRSLTGAIIMLTLVLYPYVYLMARAAFLEQSPSIMEASRIMGYRIRETTLRLTLPMARPAIVTGLTLALMETLADYGTVQYFGVSTFTTGIFRTFYGFGDTAAASQLAAILLTFIFVLVVFERYSRRQIHYDTQKGKSLKPIKLSKRNGILAVIICAFPVIFGFLIPAACLLYWSIAEAVIDDNFLLLAWNSFYLAILASSIALALALLLSYVKRSYPKNKPMLTSISLAGMGYALPGTIIAIGIITPLAWLDQRLISLASEWLSRDIGLVFSGTIAALLFAYSVRFLAVSMGAIDNGLQQIKPNLDNAAHLMGYGVTAVLRRIHLPLLSTSMITAFLIVFVDVLKELPATLILRPFDFNTLAVKAYELASDERLVDAAPPSLLIVLVGLLPVILLSRSIRLRKSPAALIPAEMPNKRVSSQNHAH
ncbi:MAG: iron(III) transport system permease protein [Cellvibrionaceae bacterium]|jgi:iron(III) transport system permease protein